MKRCKWLLALCLVLLLPAVSCAESQGAVVPVEIEQAGGRVIYPRLDGHPDALVQALTNQAILEKLGIQSLLEEASRPFNQVTADFRHEIQADVLSIVMEIHRENTADFRTVTIDLRTGAPLALSDFYPDWHKTLEAMETICLEQVEDDLSVHLENSALLPLPTEQFFVDKYGVTVYYPQDQFAYFSGYAGSVSFFAYELAGYLDDEAEGLPARLGWLDDLTAQGDTAQRIRQSAAAGQLPGITPKLGDELKGWLDTYRLLTEPDYFPGGRFFQMETGEMRAVWLLSDALSDDYDSSVVTGIRADRINLFGIQPGNSSREAVVNLMGQPENSIELNSDDAMDYYLPGGVSDYYPCGDHVLRLHYDEEGWLVSVQLLV